MSYALMVQYRDAARQKCKNGAFDEAEQLFKMALQEAKKLPAPNAYESLQLKSIGIFYFALNRYDEAEPFFKRSLEIDKALLGATDLEICKSLNHLGLLYHMQGKYALAEETYKQSLAIIEQAPYQKRPSADAKLHHLSLHLLAMVYCSEGKQNEAFTLCHQASQTFGKQTGPGGKDISMGIHDVAVKFCDNDPNPEVRKTCGWLLHIFFDQLQTEYLGTIIAHEDVKYREIVPQKGMFASTHEVLASYDEAWRPSAIYRNETLPEGYRQVRTDAPKSAPRFDRQMTETSEEEWRP